MKDKAKVVSSVIVVHDDSLRLSRMSESEVWGVFAEKMRREIESSAEAQGLKPHGQLGYAWKLILERRYEDD